MNNLAYAGRSSLVNVDEICRHVPGPINWLCDTCDAIVIAGKMLTGKCGHERFLPPTFEWSPSSWCWQCKGWRSFGTPPLKLVVSRSGSTVAKERNPNFDHRGAPLVSPYWQREFRTQPQQPKTLTYGGSPGRPFSVHELGRALGWPLLTEMSRRLGVKHYRYWYRWDRSGLTADLADTLAINACLHPMEVWGDAWLAAS